MKTAGVKALLGLSVVGLVGCMPYRRVTQKSDVRFEHLYERDLSAFERSVAVENHVDADDAWTRVGEAWIALANCRPVDREVEIAEGSSAGLVHAALVVEDTRRRLEAARRMTGGRPLQTPRLVDAMRRSDFFERRPDRPSDDVIRWPAEEETWADEKPAAIHVESDCNGLADQVRRQSPPVGGETESERTNAEKTAEKGGGPSRVTNSTVHQWRTVLLQAVDRLIDRYEDLPDARRRGRVAEMYWKSRLYGASSAHWFARVYRSDGPSSDQHTEVVAETLAPEALDERTARLVAPVAARDSPAADHLEESDLARSSLLAGRMNASSNPEQALAAIDRARRLGLEGANRWSARYLQLRISTRRSRWEKAAEVADELPPTDSVYFVPYAYRLGLALGQLDRDDRFLGVAKEVFRVRQPRGNPFLRGLYTELLRLMAQYEFEARVVELLEEVGPRSRTYRRIEEFARVCLTRGRFDNAERAARWLLRRHDDARYEPRYRAILALVAFQRNDPKGFRHQIEKLIERPDSLLEAIPTHRRARFFAPADSALASVLRRMLPMMAEWGDSPDARRRRRRWLEIVVDETQQFLRTTDESIVRSRLDEMYRLASSLLDEHPRGYAERVGADKPAPLVLGTVEVGPGRLASHEPEVTVWFPVPYSLTLVPRDDRPPSDWTFRWPIKKGASDA